MGKGWLTLTLLLGVAVIGSNSLVLSPILPDVARDLGTTPVAVSRAIAAYGGATALSALVLAPLIDRYGVKRALVAGSILLSGAMLGSATAPGVGVLIAAQAAAGLAAGVMLPAIYAAATLAGSEEDGAQTLGRALVGWSVSLVAGVPVAAILAERFGWPVPFLALAGLSLLALIGFLKLPKAGGAGSGPGGPRAVLSAASIRGVPALLGVQLLFMTAFYGVYAFFGDHLRQALDLGATMTGLVVLSYGVGFGLAAFGDAALDRIGPRRALPAALVLVAVVYLTMPLTTAGLASAFAAAFAWGLANHIVLNLVVLLLSRFGEARRGPVLGLNSAVTYLGAVAGPLGLGVVYQGWGFAATATAAGTGVAAGAVLALVALRRISSAAPGGSGDGGVVNS